MSEEKNFADAFCLPRLRPLRESSPALVFEDLTRAGVTRFYPNFRTWFFDKVVPGLDTGERRIFLREAEGRLAGVAICKRSGSERKLCTLWVEPSCRDRGIAGELARLAFHWLDTDRPLFTVPEERLSEFTGLTRSWRFSAPVACCSLYRENRTEFVYNGPLSIPLRPGKADWFEVAGQTAHG